MAWFPLLRDWLDAVKDEHEAAARDKHQRAVYGGGGYDDTPDWTQPDAGTDGDSGDGGDGGGDGGDW
ncbi:hypothetical protein ACFZBP_10055 [Streptomyces sp. NPDC008086]|uniref:hypothetical protein n=1 Tax=Streptomyces sp. NPDC008086 TaxID=3364807 RepID=UPI0036E7AB54